MTDRAAPEWKAPAYYVHEWAYMMALDNYQECCPDREIDPDNRDTWHRLDCPKRAYRMCMWCKEFIHPEVERCECEDYFP